VGHLAETETSPLGLNLLSVERRHLPGDGNVMLLLDVTNGEDDVDLLESATRGLGVCEGARGKVSFGTEKQSSGGDVQKTQMRGMKQTLSAPKRAKVPYPMLVRRGGVAMTIANW
jgi:hypothetical protein